MISLGKKHISVPSLDAQNPFKTFLETTLERKKTNNPTSVQYKLFAICAKIHRPSLKAKTSEDTSNLHFLKALNLFF